MVRKWISVLGSLLIETHNFLEWEVIFKIVSAFLSELNFLLFSCYVRFFCDPHKTIAHQAPLSIGFPRQEYWGGLTQYGNLRICPLTPALENEGNEKKNVSFF